MIKELKASEWESFDTMAAKKVLLLYTDRYYLVKQVYPFGLDLIAHHLRRSGHEASVEYPFLPEKNMEANLVSILERTEPDIVGIGIRNLDTCMSCEEYGDLEGKDYRTFFFLPHVKAVVDGIKKHAPGVPVIAGGGAFSVCPVDIMEYLDIDYGVVGEGEEPLKRFADAFPDRGKISEVPNLVFRSDKGHVVNPKRKYDFKDYPLLGERDRKFDHGFEMSGIPVQTKRGCNQGCSYCVEPLIEGQRYIFREVEEVVGELKQISRVHDNATAVFFVDTEFNLPDLTYCSQLIKRILEEGMHQRFRFSSQFLPRPFEADFAKLLAEAGFSIVLTCDSFSDEVLERNGASYRMADIIKALELCEAHGVSCTVAMIFGLPGETRASIDRSLEQMRRYAPGPLRRYEYTVGGRIYKGTALCRIAGQEGAGEHLYGRWSEGFLEPCYYCAPESPLRLKSYIDNALGYSVAYENLFDETRFQTLALSYLADQGRWADAIPRFMDAQLSVKSNVYQYFFQRLADTGRIDEAAEISFRLLDAIEGSNQGARYGEEAELAKFYLSRIK